MASSMLQVLITVWVGLHPATYTLPQKFPVTSDACQQYANHLFAHRRDGTYKRIRIECVPATGRDA